METCRPRAFENSCSVGFFYSVLILVTLCFVKSTKQGQQTGSRFHLWEVIRRDFYDNISHSEVEIINTKALNKSMQSKDDESGFIICADLDKLRSFGQTPTSLKTNTEELLDSSLTIIPINRGKMRALCFHAVTTYSILENTGAVDYFEAVHSHPPVVKVHKTVIDMLREGFVSKSSLYLDVLMSRATSIKSPLSDEEHIVQNIRIIKRALSRADSTNSSSETSNYESFASGSKNKTRHCPDLSNKILDQDFNTPSKGYVRIKLEKFRSQGTFSCLPMIIESLALEHRILSIKISSNIRKLNFEARGIIQSGTAFVEPFTDANLKGQGQIIAVSDTGVDDLHCFFFDNTTSPPLIERTKVDGSYTSSELKLDQQRRKVVSYAYSACSDQIDDEVGGHGTHTCGSAVGNCLTEGIYRDHGQAPEAKLAFYDLTKEGMNSLCIKPNLTTIFQVAKDSGAYISSNSWGSEEYDEYDSQCQDVDSFMYSNDEFLVVFAAGNNGTDGLGTILSPAYAKNSVAVGSAMIRTDPYDYQLVSQPTVSFFSSLGPTNDGRFGVDIVAPGEYIISSMAGDPTVQQDAINNGRVGVMQNMSAISMMGTSMATPTTAGALILIRQYFMDNGFWNSSCVRTDAFCKVFTPTGSLLKAVLLTSGKSMSQYSCNLYDGYTDLPWKYLENAPNNYEGFGQLDLSTVLPLKKKNAEENFELFVYDRLDVNHEDSLKFKLSLDASLIVTLSYVKITIAWTDPANNAPVSSADLINDIDLKVVVTNDVTSESLSMNYGNDNSPTGSTSKPDTVNPVERVELRAIPGYSYEIYVVGAKVTQAPQSVSLAMIYPIGGTVSGYVSESSSDSLSMEGPPPLSKTPLVWNDDYCDYCLSINFNFQNTLSKSEKTLLASFDAIGDLTLVVFDMPFYNYPYSPLFTLIIEAPNGMVGSIGGSTSWYYKKEGIYLRRWPNYIALSWNRYVNGSQLSSSDVNGTWRFYGMLGDNENSGTDSTFQYSGTISLEIDDGIYRPQEDDDAGSNLVLSNNLIIIISVLGSCLVFALSLTLIYFMCRKLPTPVAESNIVMSSVENQIHSNRGERLESAQGPASPAPVFGRVVA